MTTFAENAALVPILGNGAGLYRAPCRWCNASATQIDAPDALRLLAAAKAAGWRVEGRR